MKMCPTGKPCAAIADECSNGCVEQKWLDEQIEPRGREHKAALIRYSARDSFVLFPPAMCADGKFHDTRKEETVESENIGRTHHAAEIVEALGNFNITMKEE